jgi:hypothetical protein
VNEGLVWQIIASVFGTALVGILGWALYGLVHGVRAQIDTLQAGLNSRIDDVIARITTVENRLTGIDGSLATIHKDVGILLGRTGTPGS